MNEITRKSLDRRTMLKGVGVALGLPVLDAMTPAFAERGPAQNPPVRLAFIYVPNGIILDAFTPKTEGANFEITRVLKPLEGLKNELFVLSGLRDQNGEAGPDGAGGPAGADGTIAGRDGRSEVRVGDLGSVFAALPPGVRLRDDPRPEPPPPPPPAPTSGKRRR